MTGPHRSTTGPSRLRRCGAWLGLFALIFQAAVPLSGPSNCIDITAIGICNSISVAAIASATTSA